ncbi:MAG: hypothetical protein ACXWWU_02710 [Candidatus Limnocylindria bacterium]
MFTTHIARRPMVVTLGLLFVLLAACSPTSGVATVESVAPQAESSAEAVDADQASLDFAACMRDNGIEMADPTGEGGGGPRLQLGSGVDPQSEEFQTAIEACREHLEGLVQGGPGGPGGPGGEPTAEQQEALLAFAECMRENGVDMPDPEAGGGFLQPGSGVDPQSAEFQEAAEACRGSLDGAFGGQP